MSDGSDHPLESLSAYLDGELEGAPAAEVRAHLERCARCRGDLDDLRAIAAAMKEGAPPLPGELTDRIKSRLAREGAGATVVRFPRRLWIPSAAAATIGAVALLAIVTLRQRPAEPVPIEPEIPASKTLADAHPPEPEAKRDAPPLRKRVAVKEPAPRNAPAPPPRFDAMTRSEADERRNLAASDAPRAAPPMAVGGVAASREARTRPCDFDLATPLAGWTWTVRDRTEAIAALRAAVASTDGRVRLVLDPAFEVAGSPSDLAAIRSAIERLGAVTPDPVESPSEPAECVRRVVRLAEASPE